MIHTLFNSMNVALVLTHPSGAGSFVSLRESLVRCARFAEGRVGVVSESVMEPRLL